MARMYEKNAVVELNHVSAVRTGDIKAQYELETGLNEVEQGMLLVVDEVAKEVSLPADGTEYVMLHASEERVYESHLGRKSFSLKKPNLPRMYKLAVGDIFETNCVTTELANPKVLGKKGVATAEGLIRIVEEGFDTAAYAVVLDVVDFVTLPNETEGVKFVVAKATK